MSYMLLYMMLCLQLMIMNIPLSSHSPLSVNTKTLSLSLSSQSEITEVLRVAREALAYRYGRFEEGGLTLLNNKNKTSGCLTVYDNEGEVAPNVSVH